MKLKIYNPRNPDQYYELELDWHPDSPYFLKSHEGEGMGFTEQQLFDTLDKWFKENM